MIGQALAGLDVGRGGIRVVHGRLEYDCRLCCIISCCERMDFVLLTAESLGFVLIILLRDVRDPAVGILVASAASFGRLYAPIVQTASARSCAIEMDIRSKQTSTPAFSILKQHRTFPLHPKNLMSADKEN